MAFGAERGNRELDPALEVDFQKLDAHSGPPKAGSMMSRER
jgi:hypothetical protein